MSLKLELDSMVDITFEDVLFPEVEALTSSECDEEERGEIEYETSPDLSPRGGTCEDVFIREEEDFSVSFKSPSQFQMAQEKISLDDFEVLCLVGKGAYGKVHQVRKKNDGRIFAMKVMRKEMLVRTNNVSYTITERNILRNIRHPFIASLYYAFQTKGKVYLVMDFLNGGQLLYHMRKQAMLSEQAVKIYAAEIVLALEYLHSLDIVHRDIKPENVLLSNTGHLCITDFGLAKVDVVDDTSAKTFCGTIEYMAPEIIDGSGHGKCADWWSLGILLCDTLTGDPPFKAKQRNVLQKEILKGKFKLPNYLSNSARSLIRALLQVNPEKRLGHDGPAKVKKHPFFKGIDWNALYDMKTNPPFVPQVTGLEDTSFFEKKYLKVDPGDSSDDEDVELLKDMEDQFKGFSYVREDGLHSFLKRDGPSPA